MAEVNGIEHLTVSSDTAGNGDCTDSEFSAPMQEDMSAKDYYFDSYAHFGIHEVSALTSMSSGKRLKVSDSNSGAVFVISVIFLILVVGVQWSEVSQLSDENISC